MGSPKGFGFVPNLRYVPHALILGFGASLTLNLLEDNSSEPMKKFIPKGMESSSSYSSSPCWAKKHSPGL